MTDYYPVVGCEGTGVHLRLPIAELQTSHPEQFTLFVLAMLIIQDRDADLSSVAFLKNVNLQDSLPLPPGSSVLASTFLDIAAIHGKPYEQWAGDMARNVADFNPNDPKDSNPVPSRFGGYCNHGSVLFPTWHRPYVLLIEQAIGKAAGRLANIIASVYPAEGDKWITAAKELRLPYWDWAEASVSIDGLPECLYTHTLKVTCPQNHVTEVVNPFSFFPMKYIPSDFTNITDTDTGVTAYFKEWNRTFRHAANSPNPSDSNITELQKTLHDFSGDLRRKVAQLFTVGDDRPSSLAWDEFSNHTTQSLRKKDDYNTGSLEGVHDSVHTILGGNGNMAFPDYAAFDPIFWLHHCNIDRIYAIWEYCYPEYWMNDGYVHDNNTYRWTQDQGTYHQVYNEQLLPQSSLSPFRTAEGKYWTSDQARFLDKTAYAKHYTYPELSGPKALPADKEKARLQVQKYYGMDTEHWNAGNRHYVVTVELLEHAFNGPYTFVLYENTAEIAAVVGSVTVFARPDNSPCAGCSRRRTAGSVVRGVIPLPRHLVEAIRGNTWAHGNQLHEEIKTKLSARLVTPQGIQLGRANSQTGDIPEDERTIPRHLAPINISLVSSVVTENVAGKKPVVWSKWTDHREIFQGGHRSWRI